jgi:HEPN domain-containing protein
MDSKVPQEWANRAADDLDAARLLLDGGRHTHALFCCQQAIEKALKAIIIERTGKLPPKIHALPRLAELAKVTLPQAQLRLIAELSIDYMRTRYPEEEKELADETSREEVETIFEASKEMVQWLLSMMT